ncbi:hypothetical protein [Microbispora sp. KK1-11]|nr:hypothetical protein [Microbispora sp. KK1-11]
MTRRIATPAFTVCAVTAGVLPGQARLERVMRKACGKVRDLPTGFP